MGEVVVATFHISSNTTHFSYAMFTALGQCREWSNAWAITVKYQEEEVFKITRYTKLTVISRTQCKTDARLSNECGYLTLRLILMMPVNTETFVKSTGLKISIFSENNF